MRRALLACLALLAPLGAWGCGGEEPAPTVPASSGTPRWSRGPAEGGPGTQSVDVKADVACRARLLLAGTQAEPSLVNERVLLAGESVRLWWRAEGRRAPSGGNPVSVSDQQAGRTEGWLVELTFAWQDTPIQWRYPVVGTRPGRGRVLGRIDAMPPVLPQSLPYDTDVELCAIGVADGGSPDLLLVPGAKGARLRGTLDTDAGDRATIVRLVLRLEKERT